MYYKNVKSGFVVSYGRGSAGSEITEPEYEAIKKAASTILTPPFGYIYKLRADTLEWELVELPPMPEPGDEPTVEDKAEAFDILTGVIS